jgi:hypothetical protein
MKLWLTPVVTHSATFGAKLTARVVETSYVDVYVKLRVYDPGFDASTLSLDGSKKPTVKIATEFDF